MTALVMRASRAKSGSVTWSLGVVCEEEERKKTKRKKSEGSG